MGRTREREGRSIRDSKSTSPICGDGTETCDREAGGIIKGLERLLSVLTFLMLMGGISVAVIGMAMVYELRATHEQITKLQTHVTALQEELDSL